MKYIAVLLLAFVAVNAASVKKIKNLKGFSYNNCGPDDPIQLTSVNLTPDPIVVPGTVYLSLTLTGTVGVESPTPGAITLSYRPDDSTDYVELPCVGVLGSCQLDDVCAVLDAIFPPDQPCPDSFVSQDVPCRCPFGAGSYTLTDAEIDITTPLDTLQAGDYYLKLVLGTSDNELQCAEFTATLVAA